MALRGKRIVWASEAQEERSLNSNKVKWLTGGDTLTGRPPFGRHSIDFKPTHTLFLITNNKPHISANDYATWQRIDLIDFGKSFVPNPTKDFEHNADPNLMNDLEKESSGILAWLIRGCLEYKNNGLDRPEAVQLAVDKYQEHEDILEMFIDECCVETPEAKITAGNAFTAYKQWCMDMGFNKPNIKTFSPQMKKRFDSTTGRPVYYLGVGLLSNIEEEMERRKYGE